MNQEDKRYKSAKKVTLIGAFINICLGFMKLISGILFHSHALFADGIHSFADLLTDAAVLFASKYGSIDADATHPYGHQRIETAATFLLALLLIITGMAIGWTALIEIIQHTQTIPEWFALPIALFSVLTNEGIFHYTRIVGERIQSKLIIANAWHHRSDAASSAVVFIGILGSLAGFSYLDALAALIVAFLIIKMGWSYGWNSVKELVDTAVEPEQVQKIAQTIQHVHGVRMIHQLRTRRMGHNILVDVHVLVDPYLSVSEGHFIAQHVHHAVHKAFPDITDVTVHIDPEDDEDFCPSLDLPSRYSLQHTFLSAWKKEVPEIEAFNIHYLSGALTIDIIFSPKYTPKKDFIKRIQEELAKHPYTMNARLYVRHSV